MSQKDKQQPRKRQSLFELLLGLFLIGMAILYIGQRILDVRDYITRDTWQTTSATVVRINSKTHWLAYQYEVDGEKYIGTRLSFTEDSISDYEDRRDEFPENTQLTIYYDPNDPSRAVINREADFSYMLLIIFIVLAGVIGYFAIRRLFHNYLGFVGDVLTGNLWRQQNTDDL